MHGQIQGSSRFLETTGRSWEKKCANVSNDFSRFYSPSRAWEGEWGRGSKGMKLMHDLTNCLLNTILPGHNKHLRCLLTKLPLLRPLQHHSKKIFNQSQPGWKRPNTHTPSPFTQTYISGTWMIHFKAKQVVIMCKISL